MFQRTFPSIRLSDLSIIKKCLVTEIKVNNEKCFFTCLCRRFPSQNHEELESFCFCLDLLLANINDQQPACSIVIEDFNARCLKWCTTDKSNTAGLELGSKTRTAGYGQMINKSFLVNHHLAWIWSFLQLPVLHKTVEVSFLYMKNATNFDVSLSRPYYIDV